MDGRLRNGLWNVFHALLLQVETSSAACMRMRSYGPSPGDRFLERIWVDFRGGAADMFLHVDPLPDLRQWFYAAQWNEVYDLMEFISSAAQIQEFEDDCNAALTKENAAYRMVDGMFIEADGRALAAARMRSPKSSEGASPTAVNEGARPSAHGRGATTRRSAQT